MAEAPVVRRVPAKVNLDLLVTARRADGYHDLDSLVVFAGAHDEIRVSPASELRLSVGGPFACDVPTGEGNLVLRAARALARATGRTAAAELGLTKCLPVAAGLGGGSGDAAATLQALDELWATNLSADALGEIGLRLGADLPVCLHGRPVRMRGVGERLEPVRGLPDLPLLLVNDGTPVATPAVFRALVPREHGPRRALPPGLNVTQFAVWLAESCNALEAPAISLAPTIRAVIELLGELPDCLLARMTGSGATCFALFASPAHLGEAARLVALARPEWWSWAGVVPGSA